MTDYNNRIMEFEMERSMFLKDIDEINFLKILLISTDGHPEFSVTKMAGI